MIRHPSSIHATVTGRMVSGQPSFAELPRQHPAVRGLGKSRYAELAEDLRHHTSGSAALAAGDRFSIYQQGYRWKIIDRSCGAIVAEASSQIGAEVQLGELLDREGSKA